MPLNSATFWKVRAMPGSWPPHRAASASGPSPLECDHPFLRMIKAVDDVEHRRLAGPVGPDDGADLTLVNVEAEMSLIACTPPKDSDTLSHLQHHVAGVAPSSSACSSTRWIPRSFGCLRHCRFDSATSACRDLHVAFGSRPCRPSSKVISVSMISGEIRHRAPRSAGRSAPPAKRRTFWVRVISPSSASSSLCSTRKRLQSARRPSSALAGQFAVHLVHMAFIIS
jgi:hypothetical protein